MLGEPVIQIREPDPALSGDKALIDVNLDGGEAMSPKHRRHKRGELMDGRQERGTYGSVTGGQMGSRLAKARQDRRTSKTRFRRSVRNM
jgi:hypothetical protein